MGFNNSIRRDYEDEEEETISMIEIFLLRWQFQDQGTEGGRFWLSGRVRMFWLLGA